MPISHCRKITHHDCCQPSPGGIARCHVLLLGVPFNELHKNPSEHVALRYSHKDVMLQLTACSSLEARSAGAPGPQPVATLTARTAYEGEHEAAGGATECIG